MAHGYPKGKKYRGGYSIIREARAILRGAKKQTSRKVHDTKKTKR